MRRCRQRGCHDQQEARCAHDSRIQWITLAAKGSIAERQLFSENPGLPPVRFQVRAALPGMSDYGWRAEWPLSGGATLALPFLGQNGRAG
jgi:hypothetical protein